MPQRNLQILKARFWLGFLVCVLLATATIAARNIRCDYCRRPIQGQYYVVDGKDVCQRCYSRYPKCPGCGAPVRSSSHRYNGQKVCNECARQAGKCGHCGEILLGRYYQAPATSNVDGFCLDCKRSKPNCAGCSLPYRHMMKVNGKYFCTLCRSLLPRCDACEKPIAGAVYHRNNSDTPYCEECMKNAILCDFCGEPAGSQYITIADGRHSCRHCRSTAVTSAREGVMLLEDCLRWMREEMGMELHTPFDFLIVDNEQMAYIMGHAVPEQTRGSMQRATAIHELGMFTPNGPTPFNPRPVISVLSDLPRAAFQETVIHECAHLWQYERAPHMRDMDWVEGFAQYVASEWLKDKGHTATYESLAGRTDPWYGTGFKKVHYYAFKHGLQATLSEASKGHLEPRPDRQRSALADTRAPLYKSWPAAMAQGGLGFMTRAKVIDPPSIYEAMGPKAVNLGRTADPAHSAMLTQSP